MNRRLALALLAALVLPATLQAAKADRTARIAALLADLKKVDKKAVKSPFPGRTERFNETAINAYLAEELARKKEKEVESVTVRLLPNQRLELTGTARVEWKEVLKGSKDSWTAKILSKAGGLGSTIRVRARSGAAKGKAYVKVEDVEVNGVPLPDPLVDRLLEYVGSRQRPPMDFKRLLPLPYGIQSYKIDHGVLQLGF